MFAVFLLLVLSLLAKDATPLGDRYVLRGLSEGLALVVGSCGIALSGFRGLTWHHAGLALYMTVLLASIPVVENPLYVGLQVLSLVAVVAFSYAYVGEASRNRQLTRQALRTMLIALTGICAASLLLRYWSPELAFEQTFEGPRFRGLFSKPAMMGAAAGMLWGLGLFIRWHWPIRVLALSAAVPCLVLTQSRTFWAAAALATVASSVRYWRWRAVCSAAGVLATVAVLAIGIGIGTQLRLAPLTESKLLRQDSIETFSGRTAMWTQALEQYWLHPWLGYGFTAGGQVLQEGDRKGLSTAFHQGPSHGSLTLHNGYVQALLDSGAIGGALYLAVIVSALAAFLWYDRYKEYGGEFYCLLFLAVANLGETVIFGAGVLHGVWYWYLTVLALSLPRLAPQSSTVPVSAVKPAGQFPVDRATSSRFSLVAIGRHSS